MCVLSHILYTLNTVFSLCLYITPDYFAASRDPEGKKILKAITSDFPLDYLVFSTANSVKRQLNWPRLDVVGSKPSIYLWFRVLGQVCLNGHIPKTNARKEYFRLCVYNDGFCSQSNTS